MRRRLREGPDNRRLWVIAYDVSDDGRRTRMARLLEGLGTRLQKSVFEVRLDQEEVGALVVALEPLVHRHEDRVDFILVGGREEASRRCLGRSRIEDTGSAWEIM